MAYEHNDIATKSKLLGALNEESTMGFEHNDIVTMAVMNKAIEEGGGGGLTPYTVTLAYAEDVSNKYFHGGIDYDESAGTVVESVIALSEKYFFEPQTQISAGTYEILPIYEGGAGYFSCNSETGATITGDASIIYDEVYESYYVKVTGDCSITFTE